MKIKASIKVIFNSHHFVTEVMKILSFKTKTLMNQRRLGMRFPWKPYGKPLLPRPFDQTLAISNKLTKLFNKTKKKNPLFIKIYRFLMIKSKNAINLKSASTKNSKLP
jgi:hypothetical protein